MPRGPAEAARLAQSLVSIVAPPKATRAVLVELIVDAGWASLNQAQDLADSWIDRFISRIISDIDTAGRNGSHISLRFNSSGNDYIQGSCFVEPGDTSDIAMAKNRRSQTVQIYDSFKNITPREFELLSGRVLRLLHVEDGFVSKSSADQGIDFFGRVPLGSILKPPILSPGAEKNLSVWLVGQSKHYIKTKITTAEIRELVGSVELARAKIYAGISDPLNELKVRICDPIVYLFFTTGVFSRDSREIMNKSGVLSFDGLQLSQFLADHGVGIVNDRFDHASFMTWLLA